MSSQYGTRRNNLYTDFDTRLVRLAVKLILAQFCRAKVIEGAECVRRFSHHKPAAT